MFNVAGTNITLSRGDTGAMKISANVTIKGGGTYTFGERDRAVFTVKGGGTVLKERAYPLIDNAFTVVFFNADTDKMAPGGYSWDVRYVINPYYDEDPPEGTWTPYGDLTFPVAKGTKCMHDGTYFTAKQAIQTSEDWTLSHWEFSDRRMPVDGDQVITPNNPMNMNLLTVVGDI